jgi:hypothetical protein
MKKALFIGALACITAFYACKKDGTTTTVTKTVRDTTILNSYATGLVNADTLTAGIKVAHGSNVTGTLPAASTDAAAPKLDSFFLKSYSVIKSRYLAIYPSITSGNIAGYYVQIAGAGSYFKLDYTAAYNIRKAARKVDSKGLHQPFSARGDDEGNMDSSIVFKLPASINGDTFYVKYAAFDSEGRVSNAATARVVILPEGRDSFTDSLSGNWKYLGWNNYEDGQWQNEDYNTDTINQNYNYYSCNNDQLTPTGNEDDIDIKDYESSFSEIYSIGKYSITVTDINRSLELNLSTSTCSNYVYDKTEHTHIGNGGYTYDPSSGKFTIIYDDSRYSSLEMDFETYYLNEVTATYFILSYRANDDTDNNGFTAYYKFIKL